MFLAAVGCLALAGTVSTASWAAWFAYPGPQRAHSAHELGATLLRIMLVITGLALLILPLVIVSVAPVNEARLQMRRRPVLSRELWGVLALMAFALILASVRLGESLWYDEIAPWLEYIRYGPGPIVGNYFDPSNHVFMSLLVWMATEVVGDALPLEPAFRLPAVLAFLASVPIFYALGRVLSGGRWGAVLATLTTLAPVMVLEAVEARGYAIMLAATGGMMLCFSLGQRDRPGAWVGYAVLAALGIWAHFVTVFIPIGHAMWLFGTALLTRDRRPAIAGLCAIGLGAVLTLTLYAPILPDFLHLMQEQGSFAATVADRPTLFGAEGLHLLIQLGGTWSWWASLAGLGLLVIGAAQTVRMREPGADVAMASLLGGAVMVLAVLISGAWVYARFALFLVPPAILLMMFALRWLATFGRVVLVIGMMLLIVPWLVELAVRPPKQPLRDAVEYVTREAPNAGVLGVGLFHGVIRIYYPMNDPAWRFTTHGEQDFESELHRNPPRWVIVYYPHLLSPEREAFLRTSGYQVVQTLPGWADWGRGEVVIWRLTLAR